MKKWFCTFYEHLKNPKKAFRIWYRLDLMEREMTKEEQSEILHGWFYRTFYTFVFLTIALPMFFAWLLPQVTFFNWAEGLLSGQDVFMNLVAMHGSVWQIYAFFIGRALLLLSLQLLFSLSNGVGIVVLQVMKGWWSKIHRTS